MHRASFLVVATVLAAATAAFTAACGSSDAEVGPAADGGGTTTTDGGTTTTPTSSGIPCDVDAILAKDCRKCHSSPPQFGAPMPLMTHADLTAAAKSNPAKKVYELVTAKIDDDASPMPPPPNARLATAERDKIKAWVAAGAPASTEICGGTTNPTGPTTACKPDLTLAPATPWDMPATPGDEYVCYGVELTSPTPKHITGFAPRLDNKAIVHHIVLFEADAAYPSTPQKCDSGGSLQWRMVMGWAPGARGLELPPEAGYPIKPAGTHYVVQMHYSNPLSLAGQKDTSGFDLCTGAPRQHEADVLAFGTQQIDIQPNSTLDKSCSVTVQSIAGVDFAGIHLIAAMPHMHQLGKEMSTKLTPAGGGADIDLGSDPAYSFQTQAWYPIGTTPQGVVTKTGDKITTRCKWVNPSSDNVKFGEKTSQEMCYSFTMYYPKIQSALWSWAIPATISQCQ